MNTTDLLLEGFQKARLFGWAVVDANAPAELIALAVCGFGVPLRSRDGTRGIERLVPQRQVEAPPRSLSSRHGLGAFPFHSDAAHWLSPPQWVVMWCEADDHGRSTRFLPWSAIAAQVCRDSTANFLVKNGRKSFFIDVREKARLDAGCMVPQNAAARSLLDLATAGDSKDVITLTWRPGLVAVIDNRATLHARGEGPRDDVPDRRVLWRALLDEAIL